MTEKLSILVKQHIKEKDVLEADKIWNEILLYWDDEKEDIIDLIFQIERDRIEKLNSKKQSNGFRETTLFD